MKQFKGVAVSLLLSAVVLGGLIVFSKFLGGSQSGETTQANISNSLNAVLSSEEGSFNFGNVSMAAGNVSHNFKIKNSGSEPLVITKIYTSCMCTAATLVQGGSKKTGPFGMLGHGFNPSIKLVVNPGEEAEVEAIFDPAAHGPAGLGRVNRVITLENSGGGGKLELSFDANVIP